MSLFDDHQNVIYDGWSELPLKDENSELVYIRDAATNSNKITHFDIY